jgi:hypothetical protein
MLIGVLSGGLRLGLLSAENTLILNDGGAFLKGNFLLSRAPSDGTLAIVAGLSIRRG